jgi:HEAT repeat protein
MRMSLVNSGLLVCSALVSAANAQDPAIDSAMDNDPVVPVARSTMRPDPELVRLWIEMLDRPEVEFRARAALTVVQANERGMKGLSVAVKPLLRELNRADQHASVRIAAAKALINLDARETAPDLLGAAVGIDMRELIEPALARWDFKPARARWLERLDQPPYGRGTVLAVQSLAIVKEASAADRVRKILFDRDTSPVVRMEAARALGALRTQGSEADAAQLAADKGPGGLINRLAAALLLRNHSGDAAVKQLLALAKDSAPGVAAPALERLFEIDANLLVPLQDSLLKSADAKVRAIAIETLFRHPSDASIRQLGDRLLDPDPSNRQRARACLKALAAKPEWRTLVERETARALEGTDWRGHEQGALLAAELDHKPMAKRIVELLPSDQTQTVVAAGWALRKLAVPATLPPILEYLKGQYRRILDAGPDGGRPSLATGALDLQLSQLCQLMGQAKYLEAKSLFRQWIPINLPVTKKGELPAATPLGAETRAAAFWAMGKWQESQPDAELVRSFMARLGAVNPGDVEVQRVRTMAAIGLGRMKATAALPALREYYFAKQLSLDPVNNACGWAIEQITGEKLPREGVVEKGYVDWFVLPIKP